MKTLLITGVNGFIGSSLLGRLLKNTDWQVIGFDLHHHKIQPWLAYEQFTFHQGDLRSPLQKESLEKAVSKSDVVLPLAAVANPAIYVKQPLQVFELDFESNLEVLRLCAHFNKRFVFPSTSEVYGMSQGQPFQEDLSPCITGPIHKQRWIYSCAKQMMDRLIYAYGFEKDLSYTIFRPFNFLGPLMDDPYNPVPGASRAVIYFISCILHQNPIPLIDGGQQSRCFTFIEDALDALMAILENDENCAHQQIFNIGNPHNHHTMAEVAECVINVAKEFPELAQKAAQTSIVHQSSESYFGSGGYEDTPHRVPSIEKARTVLGWDPKTSLRDAVHQIFDYHLTQKK